MLLVAVPVVFDTGVRPVFARPKLTVAAAGALVVGVLVLVEAGVRRSVPLGRSGLTAPVAVFVAWTAVAAAASPDPRTSVFGASESLNGLATTAVLATLFLAAVDAFAPSGVRWALAALWVGAGVALLYGAVQLAGWDPVEWRNIPRGWVVWSTLGNPNDLAGLLAMLLPTGVGLLVLVRRPAVRAALAAMVVVLLVEVAVTTSRGGLLATAAGIATLAIWMRHAVRAHLRPLLAAAGAVVVLAVGATALLHAGGRTERGVGELSAAGEGTTVALRVELWRTAWRMAEAHPVTGVGPDNFGGSFDAFRSERFLRDFGPDLLATDAHNLFLHALATQGFPGLAALVVLVGAAAARLRDAARAVAGEDRLLLGAVVAGIVAYVVQAAFNRHDVALDVTAWVLLGLGFALRSRAGAAAGR